MANLFRRKSLEKLSSPEQLDKLIKINSPLVWIALYGGAFIIIVTLLWAIFGRVPITEEGQGILLNNGNVTSVYAKTKGVVTKSHISSGDKVEAGTVLYEVKSGETAEAILQLETRIQKVDAVTLTSTEDEAASDNQSVLDIKEQIWALESGTKVKEISLADLEQQYAGKEKETKDLKAQMEAAEQKYYDALAADDSSRIEYEYQTAASEYQTAETAYQAAEKQYQAVGEEAEGYLEKLEESLKEEKKERDSKNNVYEEKKQAYEDYINDVGNTKSELARLSNEYSNALSLYSAAKAERDSYKNQISSLQTQKKVDTETQRIQKETLEAQFQLTKETILDTLKQEKSNYELLADGSNILATVSGTIYSTYVTNGSMVSVDYEVARINTETDKKLYAVYYMGLETGKNVKEGMEINIYPSNISKEEYGHMKGKVISVANYVTSYADMFTKLGDETLANTFNGSGAVIEVTCEINEDAGTVSGFFWSSKKGASLELVEGSLLGGSVITEKVAPIIMFIPKLKEKLSLE